MTSSPISDMNSYLANISVSGQMKSGKSGSSGDNSDTAAFQDLMESVSAVTNASSLTTDQGALAAKGAEQVANDTLNLATANDAYAKTSTDSTADRVNSQQEDSTTVNTTEDSTNKVDQNSSTSKTDNNVKDADTKDTVEDAEDKIVKKVADELGMSVEDLEKAMEQLGLTAADLMNPDNLTKLVVDIKADGDMTSLITDENLLQTVQDLNQAIGEIVAEAGSDLGISVDEFKDMAASFDQEMISAAEDSISEETAVKPVAVENASNTEEDDTEDTSTDNPSGVSSDQTSVNTQENNISDSDERRNNSSARDDNQSSMAEHNAQTVAGDMMNSQQTTFNPEVLTSENPVPQMTSPEEIMDQITQQIRTNVSDKVTEIQMQLNPENLGNVGLTVATKEGNVTAHFTTQDELVKAALESQIEQLKQDLEQQGVKVTAVDVTVASHEFEQNLEQGNDQNDAMAEETEKLRKATHKINLNEVDENGDLIGLDELDEAEAVTAQMMQADGNTMDYKI